MDVLTQTCASVASAFEAFWKLRGQRHVVFLDSASADARLGRLSVVASDPVLVFEARGDSVTVVGERIHFEERGNPWTALRALAGRFCKVAQASSLRTAGLSDACIVTGSTRNQDGCATLPTGALIGYLGYGLRRFVERVPARLEDDLNMPDAWFGVYDRLLVFDHETRQATIVSTGVDELGQSNAGRARRRMEEWLALLARPTVLPVSRLSGQNGGTDLEVRSTLGHAPDRRTDFQVRSSASLVSNLSHDDYERAVRRILDYIAAGDVYQINFTQRFGARTSASADLLYHALRTVNPAPFAAYLDCGVGQVLSSSPERFLRIQGREIQTRPIKGTRARTGDEQADQKAARDLLMSAKDQAELLMITDLERNDLGRVCAYGSVHVPELVTLESYATVLHLVSTVEGRLADGVTAVDAVRACFPGGSITGAPKIRAMEIIDELEPSARGVYTGAIGYLGFNDCSDFNIAIRTMIHQDGNVHFHAGGGIVADSAPALEYEETLHKARGMVQALALATVESRKPRAESQRSET